ncbi:SsrA-binding protein SmpB [Arcobacter sp. F2176]|jgi:SsrA-binding protein|uniref:SsrA-binding protein SmpB n=1 Tax=Arcobacter TaxID=28196 RepID=UPI00215A0223|nr:SsrA-binding protein SmpB [Arcobacter sp. F2176]|tara:strand:+ start:515 stop:985 length:471 start_codon:yes stop_codon:yes gene_type:complete
MAKKEKNINLTFKNKKAFHDYFILESFEAGIELLGSEVKSIREGRVNLKDSYIRIIKNEVFVLNMHISYLETTHAMYRPEETRPRKLLLHRKQIDKLFEKVTKEGMTVVPLKLYFNAKNFAKLQIASAQGKKLYDKRADLKEKSLKRESEQAIKNW